MASIGLYQRVRQDLEGSGSLLDLRTQIRTSLMARFLQQGSNKKNTTTQQVNDGLPPIQKKPKRRMIANDDDKMALKLIIEWLQFFQLKNTQLVLQNECQLKYDLELSDYMKKGNKSYMTGNKVYYLKKFGLIPQISGRPSQEKPLITQILKSTKKQRSSRSLRSKKASQGISKNPMTQSVEFQNQKLVFLTDNLGRKTHSPRQFRRYKNMHKNQQQFNSELDDLLDFINSDLKEKEITSDEEAKVQHPLNIESIPIMKSDIELLEGDETQEDPNNLVAQIDELAEMVDEMNEEQKEDRLQSPQVTQGTPKLRGMLSHLQEEASKSNTQDLEESKENAQGQAQEIEGLGSFDSKSIFSEEALKYFDDLMVGIEGNQTIQKAITRQENNFLMEEAKESDSNGVDIQQDTVFMFTNSGKAQKQSNQQRNKEEFNDFSLNDEDEKIWDEDFDFDLKME